MMRRLRRRVRLRMGLRVQLIPMSSGDSVKKVTLVADSAGHIAAGILKLFFLQIKFLITYQ